MTGIAVVPPQRLALGMTILRIVIGIVFIVHGAQKLFVYGIAGATGAFAQMHIPLPMIAAPVVTIVEFVGGIALVIGFFTRIAAILIAIDMAGAILFVHGRNGFFMPTGYEFAFALMGACIALAIGGAGEYSVDNRRR
jgi:putative oxidoreductase